ncbi:MAG TPA: hypothetical protein VFX17_04050 [Patescibacteria group bacterium]|nr:hypothetical protein [Patescibacteria group bacterium]
METILPGVPEINESSDPVLDHLVELRTRLITQGDVESTIEELRWYMGLRDSAESIQPEDRIVWKQLHGVYQDLSDEQILRLINELDKTESGDYINQ